MEQAPQGSGHGTELVRVQGVSGQCSQTHGLIFGWCCMEQGVGPFQLGIFYDSMFSRHKEVVFMQATLQSFSYMYVYR